jgi:hypothetical protein
MGPGGRWGIAARTLVADGAHGGAFREVNVREVNPLENGQVPARPRLTPADDEPVCTFCLHFSADRRTQRLTSLEAGRETTETGRGGGWSVESSADAGGARFGSAANPGRIACRWVLLRPGQDPPPGCEPMLRRPGERVRVDRLLTDYPMRPLLVTLAAGADLPSATIDAVHRAVLASLRPRDKTTLPGGQGARQAIRPDSGPRPPRFTPASFGAGHW